jgi:hypothetical protein
MNTITRTVCSCFAALLATGAAASIDTGRFEFMKQLAPPSNATATVGRVILDDDLYETADDGYGNMRIVAGVAQEARFLVRRQTMTEQRRCEFDIQSKTSSFRKMKDNSIEVILETMPDAPAAAYLDLATGDRNFEKQVNVSGSDDGETWTPLATRQPIFDYSRYVDLGNSRVNLQPGRFRLYRVEISDITETSRSPFKTVVRGIRGTADGEMVEAFTTMESTLHIENLSLRGERILVVEKQPVLMTYATTGLTVTNDAKAKMSVVSFQLRRQPVTSLYIDTPDVNFVRNVTVEHLVADPVGNETWRRVANAQVKRIRIGDIDREQLKISLGPVLRAEKCRIVIFNQDNPPLAIAGVRAEGEVMEALFLASPGASHRLLYKPGEIERPSYDIGSVLGDARESAVDNYTLSGQMKNPAFRGPLHVRPIGSKRVFVAALVVMVLVLVWIIARAAKNVEATPTG